MTEGFFITFEGPDGSGKTTVANEVTNRLLNSGYNVVLTREPGGIEIAEQIRNIILDIKNTKMDSKTEALLYAASRRQHLIEKVIPALKENKIVICDRFIDSSLAYQGYARSLGIDNILKINEFAIEGLMPNLTIYLDVDEKIAISRIESRNEEKNRLDRESILFHHNVIEGYKEVINKFSNRIKIVDASKQLEDVINDCYSIVISKIND